MYRLQIIFWLVYMIEVKTQATYARNARGYLTQHGNPGSIKGKMVTQIIGFVHVLNSYCYY